MTATVATPIADTKAALAELSDLLETFVEPANYLRWLDQQAKFHSYSWRNTLLILSQCPHATAVAGFKTWMKQHGRAVRKGEVGIRILAPVPFTKKDENGKEQRGMVFKTISVFDVTQTDPMPDAKHVFEPEPPLALDSDEGKDLYDLAAAWMIEDGCNVQSDNARGVGPSAHGWYDHSIPEIFVRPSNNLHMLETLIHETAHRLQKFLDKKEQYAYAGNEVVVESVAYIVCRHFGLDVKMSAVPYIRSWLTEDRKGFEKGLGTISRLSEKIIVELDRRLGAASAAPVEA